MNEQYHVKDISLAGAGSEKIEWAEQFMPVLVQIKQRFAKGKPLSGINISACLHVTAETANLMIALKEGGAKVCLCASNPLSTQDDTAASLVKHSDIPVFAIRGANSNQYYEHIVSAINHKPVITMDDGADLVNILSTSHKILGENVRGGTEETTTGVVRLRNMAKAGVLPFPIIAINDAQTKHLFDNRYGTGQSTFDGIMRATNVLIAGLTVVVCGYGWCGRGVAMRAKGLGARVVITEIEPLKALEAVMDGYEVQPMSEASKLGDIFITVTSNKNVIREYHYQRMKDRAMICNAGHFNVEIDIASLDKISKSKRKIRNHIDEYTLKNGKKLYLLGEGRLINLACAEGHPATVMDMSFANQVLSVEYLIKNSGLQNLVYPVPEKIDNEVARLKLESMNIHIDHPTQEQSDYMNSWSHGT